MPQADPAVLASLTLGDFAPHHSCSAAPLNPETAGAAVLAGCRARLLGCREASLAALREGFSSGLDLQLQLAPFPANELIFMSQARATPFPRHAGCLRCRFSLASPRESPPSPPPLPPFRPSGQGEPLDGRAARLL